MLSPGEDRKLLGSQVFTPNTVGMIALAISPHFTLKVYILPICALALLPP